MTMLPEQQDPPAKTSEPAASGTAKQEKSSGEVAEQELSEEQLENVAGGATGPVNGLGQYTSHPF